MDDKVIAKAGIAIQIYCKVWHMKKALAEFAWADDQELLTIETREQHPKLSLSYKNEQRGLETKFQFREDIEDLIYKDIAEAKLDYSIESLRLAFTRTNAENLSCVLIINFNGIMNVKIYHENLLSISESSIIPEKLFD